MRGYYLEEKPRLSIFLLPSSVRDLSSLLSISLSVFPICFPAIAPLENMMQVRPAVGVEVVFFCLAR